MQFIIDIVIFVFILGVIVIIHEFGHLIAAKHFHVFCKEFSIGMGPLLWQKKNKETNFSIRLFPIGGYVSMAGEDGEVADIPYERTIQGIKKWKQIIVMAAGAIMNIVLAWVLFVSITAVQGQVATPGLPQIGGVKSDSPAQKAGIKSGDIIKRIESENQKKDVKTWNDVTTFIQYYHGSTTLLLDRNGKNITVEINPQYDKKENMYMMGVYQDSNSYKIKDIKIWEAIPYGTQKMVSSVTAIIDALGKIVQGEGLKNLSGPIGIYKTTSQITKEGILSSIALVGLLSVNVGIFNLLPIPILDGGRILIILVESITRRRLSERMQTIVMTCGLLFLIAIMVFSTWNDITQLF